MKTHFCLAFLCLTLAGSALATSPPPVPNFDDAIFWAKAKMTVGVFGLMAMTMLSLKRTARGIRFQWSLRQMYLIVIFMSLVTWGGWQLWEIHRLQRNLQFKNAEHESR